MKITNGKIVVNLPSKLRESDLFKDDPFVIFSCDNFLDGKCYFDFIKQMQSLYENADFEKDATGKKRFKFEPNKAEEYRVNKIITDFIGVFKTLKFRNWFKKTHEPFFDIGFLGSVFPKSRIVEIILRIINGVSRTLFRRKAFNVYHTSIEFSKIGRGASIAPHTDSYAKRMALVFYTPFNEPTRDMVTKWGTQFWKSKPGRKPLRSWASSHKLENQELEKFHNENEVFASIEYKANKVNGFIKNDLSWHSVEKNIYNEERVAIVINVYDIAASDQDISILKDIQDKMYGKKS